MLMLFAFNSAYLHAQCDIEVTVSSDGYGDVTTWELQDDSGTPVLSGGTYPLGYSDTQTTTAVNPPYTLVFTINNASWCDNEPDYIVNVDGVEVLNGTVLVGCVDDVVSIGVPVCPPAIPPSPIQDLAAPTCATGTDLTVSGTPDPGIDWYWQATAGGTSTADLVSGPYTVYVNGTYYVRAYDAVNDLWSNGASSVTVSNIPVALDPPAPLAAQSPVCTPGTTISVDPAPAGYEYYWQGTTMGGTSTAEDAATPYDVTSTGTYYVAAYETATQCWSNTVGVTVTVQTEIPDAPTTTTTVYDICSGLSNFDIEATGGSSSTILNQTTSFGTDIESPGPLTTIPLVVPALPAGATLVSAQLLMTNVNSINGSWRSEIRVGLSGMYTLANTQISALTSAGLITPDPTINLAGFPTTGGTLNLLLSESFDDDGAGTIDATFGEVTLILNYSTPSDLAWYDAATAGTQVGTGNPFNAIGNSVMADPSSLGTYEFYAASVDGACESATRTLVTVNVIDVNADLIPMDETCVGYADGSFALGTIECGTEPFQYSIDGGAFGAIPTDLTPGTYSVVIQDATMLESNPIMVTIGTTDTSIPVAPTAIPSTYDACAGDLSVPIEATVTGGSVESTYTLNMIDSWGDGWNGASVDILLNGIVVATGTLPNGAAGSLNFNVFDGDVLTTEWNSGTFDGECSFNIVDNNAVTIGSGTSTTMITYNVPLATYTINWYDAAAAGTFEGTGSPFETVGTNTMPTTTQGVYEFYAETALGSCVSNSRTLVTVNIVDVNVTLTPIDETCVGYADGSFALGTVECGTAPFLYSIDGGAFGAIPTDLAPGTYSVVIQDAAMLESNPIMVTIGTTSTVIPDAPVAVQSVYNYCVTSDPMEIEVGAPASGCPIEINVFSGGFGDEVTWTVTDNGGATVLSGGPYPFGYDDLQNIPLANNGPYNLSISTIGAFNDNTPNYSVTVDGTVVFSGVAPGGQVTVIGPFTCPPVNAVPEWYSAVSGGDFLGDQAVLNALGTTVIPVGAQGTYEFYAYNNLNGCYSVNAELVTVNLSSVLVDLVAINESCIGYADGSFSAGTIECGNPPFMYSVDGGAFGSIPTNLIPGSYEVVVQDVNLDQSAPVTVVIGTTDTYIPAAPTANPDFYNICSGDLTQPIEAEADGSATVNYSFGTNIESYGPLLTIPLNVPALPAGATVTSAELLLTNVNSINGSWRSEIRVGLSGIYTLGDTQISPLTSGGLITPDPTIALAGFPITGGTLNLLLSETFDDGGAGTLDATFGEVVLSISYTLPATTINWYDASTAGTNIGSGSPFESVGTSVLASPATVGVYEFYAESMAGNCISTSRTLVTVNVNNVNVELDVEDATCNNGNDGLFTIGNVYCGFPPFQYSIDGGAFSPNSSGLTAGTHTVIVRDINMDESAEYTITVGSAPEPSNVVVVSYNNEEATIEWIANGSETEWNIEWGTPGFTPGTGTEVGSGTANSIPFIITGLDGDTEYDIYVSANCGVGTTTGDWSGTNVLTDCDPIPALAWCESFEDNSETIHCWTRIDNNGDGNITNGWEYSQWTYWSNADAGQIIANTGEYAATNFNQFTPAADDWLITPRLTLTNNEVLTFHYLTLQGSTNFTVLLSTTGKSPADFTEELMADAVYGNTTYQDTSIDLSAFGGDVYIAFVRTGATTTFSGLFIDDVCIDICTPNPGIDGSIDICRLDDTTDLNSVITSDYTHGTWSFPANPSVVNGSTFNISTLASGSYDVEYIVTTACTADTTIATINVFGPSTAGNDGVITACMNEPINLLSGLTGTVDLGGQWYDPGNNPISVSITASNLPGSFNYDYITSNGVCPSDTSNIVLTVLSTCDYLDIQELVFGDMNVYPNPTDGMVFVSSTGNAEVFNYELTDVNGRVISVKEAAINGTETAEISLEQFEPGIYMIRVYNASAEKTFRVVKQ